MVVSEPCAALLVRPTRPFPGPDHGRCLYPPRLQQTRCFGKGLLTVSRSEMGDWKLTSKGISVGVVLGNGPGEGVESWAIRQMNAASDALHCVEMAAPHGRQCVAPQDIIGSHNALDSELAGRFSAHLEVGNRCSHRARGHDGDEEDGELHRGGLSISIG